MDRNALKRLGAVAVGLLIAVGAYAGTFNLFQPATGILKGNSSTYVTTAAASTDVRSLWTGTCDNTTYLRGDGTCQAPPGTGGGTVNSVAQTVPAGFSVTGSPITNTGTLAISYATGQAANRFLATPDGTTGALSLRTIVAGDLPAISLTTGVTGTLPVANGGTGVATVPAYGFMLGANTSPVQTLDLDNDEVFIGATGAYPLIKSLPDCDAANKALNYDTTTHAYSCATISAGTGTVTSVAQTMPSVFSVAGSPVTASGTLAVTFATGQTQNQVLASPNGSSGAVALRALVGADIPQINLGASGNGGVTGNLPVTNLNGGTGASGSTYWAGDGTWKAAGGASAANPTATIGLTAVNGAAATYLRSDGAPALSQSIAPTWTGQHEFDALTTIFSNTGGPLIRMTDGDAGTNATNWRVRNNGGTFLLSTENDAGTVQTNALSVSRTAAAITNLTFGNGTDNPTYTISGTGDVTAGGRIISDGTAAQRLYLNSSNASGPYATFARGGSSFADWGNGKQCGSGFTLDAFGLCARTGNAIQMGAGGSTTPTWVLDSSNNVQQAGTLTATDSITSNKVVSGTVGSLNGSSAAPGMFFTETDGAAGAKLWRNYANGSLLTFDIAADDGTANVNWLTVTRSTGAVSNLSFGNATNNPTYSFLGTGAGTFAGGLVSTKSGGNGLIINDGSAGKGTIAVQSGAATKALFGLSGAIEGDTSVDASMFAETGGAIRFYTNGSAAERVTIGTTGNISVAAGDVFPATSSQDLGAAGAGWRRLLTVAGSASLPVVANASDTNTGLYFPSTDVAALAANGNNYFQVDGTTGVASAPNKDFSVGSTSAPSDSTSGRGAIGIFGTSSAILDMTVNGTREGYLYAQSGTVQLFANTGNTLTSYTNATLRSTIASDGGLFMAGATGGSQGAGTVNATQLYVQGVAVNAGVQTTATATLTMTNASCTANNVTVRFVKVGDQVTVRIPSLGCATFNGSDKVISASITFPAGMTPAVTQQFATTMYNGNNLSATLRLPTSGSWQWKQNAASGGVALTTASTGADGAAESTVFTYTLN